MLLILDSLGTTELLFVGLIAMLIFGPRKIPELARKAAKIIAEFRKVSDDFRATWEREAMLDEDEIKAFDFSDEAIAREPSPPMIEEVAGPEAFNLDREEADPEVEEAGGSEVPADSDESGKVDESGSKSEAEEQDINDKANWL